MLTKRLKKITDLVKKDKRLADIGTDHGLVPASLLENKVIPHAIVTDINEKPLLRAKNLLSEKKLISNTDFRIGSGLIPLKENEVDQVIIAGMGGDSIISILKEDLKKSHSYNYFVLQPMTHVEKLREFLIENNFEIVKEYIIEENTTSKDRFFNILVVKNGTNSKLKPFDMEFGLSEKLEKDENYFHYIKYQRDQYKNRIDKMSQSNNEKTQKRRLEFERRFNFLNSIYESFQNNKTN